MARRFLKYEREYLEQVRLREAAESAVATERAAREEAEALAVWAVREEAFFHETAMDLCWGPFGDENRIECDGTDAGILAALRRAMKGEG